VKVPEAGWISIGQKNPLVFVPLKRYKNSRFPGMLPVILGNSKEACIAIRPPSSNKNLPQFAPARIKQVDENKYQLGPFVAILTSDGGTPFSGNHRNFADIIRTGRDMGVTVYVLTPRGIEKGATTVSGYLLDPRSTKIRWIPAKLPFPNVVYNRIPNRKTERKPEVQEAIKILKETPGVHFFNPGFFDKWTLYQQLRDSDELKDYLPTTLKLKNLATLKQMIANYPVLYLKPIEGKAGIGMMRIAAVKGGYKLIHQETQEKKQFFVHSLPQLWRLIQKLAQKKAYIVQQGIPLAEFKGRPFDVRMLLQKDGTGAWGLTGAGIRVAGDASISTHVPMGGMIEDLEEVFRETFKEQAEEIRKKVEDVGLRFAQFIESKQPSELGEMSMDLGIEPNGTLWFFEANAKPMKFDEPEIRTRSLRHLILYSLHLSGFKQKSGDE
jgi:hypothetical protein